MRLLGLQGSRTEPCNQVNIIADGDNNLLLIIVNNSVFFLKYRARFALSPTSILYVKLN